MVEKEKDINEGLGKDIMRNTDKEITGKQTTHKEREWKKGSL